LEAIEEEEEGGNESDQGSEEGSVSDGADQEIAANDQDGLFSDDEE
jgi:hypothetical protein